MKPSQEYFAKVFECISEKEPPRVLFWDDMEKNVRAAQEFGFAAHQFTEEEDFVRRMREYFPLHQDAGG